MTFIEFEVYHSNITQNLKSVFKRQDQSFPFLLVQVTFSFLLSFTRGVKFMHSSGLSIAVLVKSWELDLWLGFWDSTEHLWGALVPLWQDTGGLSEARLPCPCQLQLLQCCSGILLAPAVTPLLRLTTDTVSRHCETQMSLSGFIDFWPL